MKKKQLTWIFVALLIGLLMSCSNSESNENDPQTIYHISEYFPVATGNRWTYSTGDRYFSSDTLTNSQGTEGLLFDTDTYEFAMFTQNSGNGFIVIGEIEKSNSEKQEFPTQLVLIPEDVTIGDSYHTSFSDYRLTTQFIGEEVIDVPAGQFKTIRFTLIISSDSENLDYKTDIWFAKNIGIVKIDREDVIPPNDGCIFVCRADNDFSLVNAPAELESAIIGGKIY